MTPWHLSCGSWDLVPWPGIERSLPPLEAQSLSYWNTREVPPFISSSIIWVSLTVWDVMISQALKFWFPLAPLCQPLEVSWVTPQAPSFPPLLPFPFIHHLSSQFYLCLWFQGPQTVIWPQHTSVCIFPKQSARDAATFPDLVRAGLTFGWLTYLGAWKTNFKRNQGLTVKPISWLTRRITVWLMTECLVGGLAY